MPAKPAKFVTYYGSVYKLTAQQWLNYVDHRSNGGTIEILHFGKLVGPVSDVTDWTGFDAQRERAELLTAMTRRRRAQ